MAQERDQVTTTVKLHLPAFAGLRKSEGVQAMLRARAEKIAAAAGDGNDVFVDVGATRARAAVVTTTAEAMLAEAKDRALTRAIDAGRG